MGEDKKTACAAEALRLARTDIGRRFPGFGAALQVPGMSWTKERSGTDAVRLYWNADEVLTLFMGGERRLERRYLHLLLHGLFLHPFRGGVYPERIWWLACDLMTEYRIDRLYADGLSEPAAAQRNRLFRKLREDGVNLHEYALAEWLQDLSAEKLSELEHGVRTDNHAFWRARRLPENQARSEGTGAERQAASEAVHRFRAALELNPLYREEHRRQAGGSAGEDAQRIVLQEERGYDYRNFLRQFALDGEELIPDPESFDYIPYDYSRKMYRQLVLLEPLEYREVHRLQEFVIAIDTSGSCSGEVVRRFLTETWAILNEKECFFRDMRIHLIQCDCAVQEHVCVTCEEEWRDYLSHLTVKGHGDTDFTPVFRLVEQMQKDGELTRLKGLLYFTDGDGIYPDRRPPYETAFVFLNEKLRKGRAPAWAHELTLYQGNGE